MVRKKIADESVDGIIFEKDSRDYTDISAPLTIDESDFLDTDLVDDNFSKSLDKVIREQDSIKKNDIVIHIDYGIGKFLGLESVNFDNVARDFIKLEYADNVKLLVPVENFDLITKFSDFDENIKLDKLGSLEWSSKKARLKKKIKDLSDKLIKIASQRKIKNGRIFNVGEAEYQEFCNQFPFQPTKDQVKASSEILSDLSSGRIMDRLLCGDVGFGKTEVAIRSAFAVVGSKYKAQVAVVVPTTILCRQHYKKFLDRFKSTDVKIESLSRFNSINEANKIRKELENGDIDIIVGTHSLLSKRVKFKDLGLIIIDEEQRFGVLQKERLKEMRLNTHILSMSATPIPRTLQMSIAGIKDLSIISTPPVNRLSVKTSVCKYNDEKIKQIIEKEIKRDGRVFLVVPRIADIIEVEARFEKAMPELKYGVVHGQLKSEITDEIMNNFYEGKFNVLIATSIVENGIDIQDANTIIVYRANNFGLAQLYQLRGRVGRGNKQGFAYLTIKDNEVINDVAKKRLSIIESIKDLNSSFVISSMDMDIRGFGNILGEEQSGHIRDIGVNLYNKMLRNEINNAKRNNNGEANEIVDDDYEFSPEIKLNISTAIPTDYIDNINIKMKFYKRIADSESLEELRSIAKEMKKDYGELPESVENLMRVAGIKIDCKRLNIQKFIVKDDTFVISFYKNKFANPDGLLECIFSSSNMKLHGENVICKYEKGGNIFDGVGKVLRILENLRRVG